MPISLTPAQADMQRIICELYDAGLPITYRGLAAEMDLASTRRPHEIVGDLIERGWIERHGRRLAPLHRLPDLPPARLSITIAGDVYLWAGEAA